MPRATVIRGAPVSEVARIRQAMHEAQVQAAKVPAQVTAAVDEVADELGTSLSALNAAVGDVEATLVTIDERLNNLENPEP